MIVNMATLVGSRWEKVWFAMECIYVYNPTWSIQFTDGWLHTDHGACYTPWHKYRSQCGPTRRNQRGRSVSSMQERQWDLWLGGLWSVYKLLGSPVMCGSVHPANHQVGSICKKNQLSVSPTCHNKIVVITCVIVTNFLTTNDTLEQEMLECSLHLPVWCPNAKSHVY